MSGQSQRDDGKVVRRADGTILEQSEAPRNPKKRVMDISQELAEDSSKDKESQPVIRGDGTVLPKRSEEQPPNPMKRTMDTSKEDNKEL